MNMGGAVPLAPCCGHATACGIMEDTGYFESYFNHDNISTGCRLSLFNVTFCFQKYQYVQLYVNLYAGSGIFLAYFLV